jgi:hypothetical protein
MTRNYFLTFSNYVPRVEINVQVIEDDEEEEEADEANNDQENGARN